MISMLNIEAPPLIFFTFDERIVPYQSLAPVIALTPDSYLIRAISYQL